MRARADEMAALLDEAAPRAARIRKRRTTAVPAAVAAFGALSIGGVGLALGLTPTGAEGVLPATPSPALADPGSPAPTAEPGAPAGGVGPEGPLADPAVAGADLIRPDDGNGPTQTTTGAPDGTGKHSASSPAAGAPAPHPTSARSGSASARPRSTSSRPAPTTTHSASPRSTSTHPATTGTSAGAPRPVDRRSALDPATGAAASRSTTAPARSSAPGGTDPSQRGTVE